MSDNTLRGRVEEGQAVLPGMAEHGKELETLRLVIGAQDQRNAELAASMEELLTSMKGFSERITEGTATGIMSGLLPLLTSLAEGQLKLAQGVAANQDRLEALETLLRPALRGEVRLMAQRTWRST
jgi:hypothetical protein